MVAACATTKVAKRIIKTDANIIIEEKLTRGKYEEEVKAVQEANKKQAERYPTFVVDGANMICSKGKKSCRFKMDKPREMEINSKIMLNVDDAKKDTKKYFSFVECEDVATSLLSDKDRSVDIGKNDKGKNNDKKGSGSKACVPKLMGDWTSGYKNTIIDGYKATINTSECECKNGGRIVFANDGQSIAKPDSSIYTEVLGGASSKMGRDSL